MEGKTKKLEILVGDDAFKEFFVEQIFNNTYIPQIKEGLNDYEINIETETDPSEVIKKASRYDVIVTDLDYTGGGKGKEGYDVVDAVSGLNPKPLIILCTSSDAYEEIKERTEGRIDYHAGTGKNHKFDDLVEVIVNHYTRR